MLCTAKRLRTPALLSWPSKPSACLYCKRSCAIASGLRISSGRSGSRGFSYVSALDFRFNRRRDSVADSDAQSSTPKRAPGSVATPFSTVFGIIQTLESLPKDVSLDRQKARSLIRDLGTRFNLPDASHNLYTIAESLRNDDIKSNARLAGLLHHILYCSQGYGYEGSGFRIATLYDMTSGPPGEPYLPRPAAIAVLENLLEKGRWTAYAAYATLAVRDFYACPPEDTVRRKEQQAKVFEYLEKGADKGTIRSMVALGDLYATGLVFEENGRQAEEWWTKAAAREGIHARNAAKRLAFTYFGCTHYFGRNQSEALRYFEIGADRSSEAAFIAGLHYYLDPNSSMEPSPEEHAKKWGVKPSDEKAAEYFKMASRVGEAGARMKLAEMILLDRASFSRSEERTLWNEHAPMMKSDLLRRIIFLHRGRVPVHHDDYYIPPSSPLRKMDEYTGFRQEWIGTLPPPKEYPTFTEEGRAWLTTWEEELPPLEMIRRWWFKPVIIQDAPDSILELARSLAVRESPPPVQRELSLSEAAAAADKYQSRDNPMTRLKASDFSAPRSPARLRKIREEMPRRLATRLGLPRSLRNSDDNIYRR